MSAKLIKTLRASLPFMSGKAKRELMAQIAELEAETKRDPERVNVIDPEPNHPEAVCEPLMDADSAGETETRQTGGCGSVARQCPVDEPTGKPVSHGEAGGSPALTKEPVVIPKELPRVIRELQKLGAECSPTNNAVIWIIDGKRSSLIGAEDYLTTLKRRRERAVLARSA